MRRVLVPPALRRQTVRSWFATAAVDYIAGETMGTSWSVRLVRPPDVMLTTLHGAIGVVLDRIVAQMSTWKATSDISRFNHAPAGSWHQLPPDFFHVLRYALALAAETGGAYDPAIGALVDLWGFGPNSPRTGPPSAEETAQALPHCDWTRVALDPSTRRVLQPGGVHLDLSSIAKGYAVDCLGDALDRHGVHDYLVEIGGELRGEGIKPDGTPWWVGLEESIPGLAPIILAAHGQSIATSGDAQRVFVVDGHRFSHTIDPRNGLPVSDHIAAVTVVHRSCMEADALATALTVLGAEEGWQFALTRQIAARMVLRGPRELEERMTPALAAMLDEAAQERGQAP